MIEALQTHGLFYYGFSWNKTSWVAILGKTGWSVQKYPKH
jgi:hypothetical protein